MRMARSGSFKMTTAITAVDADVKAGVSPVTDAQLQRLISSLTAVIGPDVVAALGAAITKGVTT